MPQIPAVPQPTQRPHGRWRPIVLLAVVAAVFIAAQWLGMGRQLDALRDWILSWGEWGPAVFVLVYVVSTVLALPATPLTVAAGAMYGSLIGVALISVASLLGAVASFLVARYFARDAVARWLSTSPRFREIDRLTEEHGTIIVALTRLIPILPFTLVNYSFGLTRVRFWTYAWWTWVCLLPANVLYVVGADAITRSLTEHRVPWVLVGVFVVSSAIIAVFVCYARKKLRQSETNDDSSRKGVES